MTETVQNTIKAFVLAGHKLQQMIAEHHDAVKKNSVSQLTPVLKSAEINNKWFTEENVLTSMEAICKWLNEKTLLEFVHSYPAVSQKRVGVISAGNIPFVGFHDLMVVLLSGHRYIGKLSSDDTVLLPFFVELLKETKLLDENAMVFADKLKEIDVAIATGSNNSSRYFEYYFSKIPHLIRMNRNGVAVLNGNESPEQLHALGNDVLTYFGLGCRNVSKLYVPYDYNFSSLFENVIDYSGVMKHNKYMNNYDYNNTLLLMKNLPFLTNNFLIVRPDVNIASPIAVLHYQEYNNEDLLTQHLKESDDQIQCIITANENIHTRFNKVFDFGMAQQPMINDFADGVDTMKFLTSLS